MSTNIHEEIERIKTELATNHCIIERNNQRLESDPWLEQQIIFRMENTRFLITELESCDREGNDTKCAETTLKAQKVLDGLYELLRQLD